MRILLVCTLTLFMLAQNAQAKLIEQNIMAQEALQMLKERLLVDYEGDVEVRSFGSDLNVTRECIEHPQYNIQDYKNLSSRIVVKASCIEPQWSVYLPFKAEIFKQVVMTNKALSKGSILTENDIILQRRNIVPFVHGYFEKLQDVVGLETNTLLRTGSLVKPDVVSAPIVINRGDLVTIKAQVPGIVITMHGIAQNHGALGELVKVKNSSSNKIVEGKVISRGAIQVLM